MLYTKPETPQTKIQLFNGVSTKLNRGHLTEFHIQYVHETRYCGTYDASQNLYVYGGALSRFTMRGRLAISLDEWQELEKRNCERIEFVDTEKQVSYQIPFMQAKHFGVKEKTKNGMRWFIPLRLLAIKGKDDLTIQAGRTVRQLSFG